MNKPLVRGLLVLAILILAGLGYIQLDGTDGAANTSPPGAPLPPAAQDARGGGGPPTFEVEGPRGATDLAPTLDRIRRGISHSHRNDGSVFGNREGRLPSQPRGYYREFVHPTPAIRGPGAQRVVIGREGEVYYTPDHYESFVRIDTTLRLEER